MMIQVCKNVMDMFINGVCCGFIIVMINLLFNVVMVFVIIQVLKIIGLFDWVGYICQFVMVLWGFFGEVVMVFLVLLMSMGGVVGVVVSLVIVGVLSGYDVIVLLLVIYLMGNLVQNVGCCFGIVEVNVKYYLYIIVVCVINVLLLIWVMQFIV